MSLLQPRRPATRAVSVAVVVALASLAVSLVTSLAATPGAEAARTARPDSVLSGPASPDGAQVARVASVASAADVPVPAMPRRLPAAIEDPARYVPADSCDPHAKPGTLALARLLATTYPGRSFGIERTCGTDPLPTSEHYDGRAVDFFLDVRRPDQRAQARALIGWLLATDTAGHPYANARRLGVMYLIWNDHIWGSYRAADGWRAYSGCRAATARSFDTSCHRDHLHLSLSWEGAMGRTSFWADSATAAPATTDFGPCREADLNWAAPYSGPRADPCPSFRRVTAPAGAGALLRTLTTYSGMVLARGDTGPVVRAVQQAVGTTPDGSFGPATQGALGQWQAAQGLPATGRVDADTWRALLRVVATRAARPAHPELTPFRRQVLRLGSSGPAVTALQHRLHRRETGGYGTSTRDRIEVFQRRHLLSPSGIVDGRTWTALGA